MEKTVLPEKAGTSKGQKWNKPFLFFLVILMGLGLWARGTVMVAARPLLRYGESRLVSWGIREYQVVETPHFLIYYQEIDEETLQMVARTGEASYEMVSRALPYEPAEKLVLILYSDGEALMKNTLLQKDTAPMGVYFGNALHVLNPRLWILAESDYEETFLLYGPVLHELVHLFVDHLAGGNFPLWFTEGVSLYYEYALNGVAWGREIVLPQTTYTADQVAAAFDELDQYTAYTVALRMIYAYIEKEGESGLLDLLKRLGRGESFTFEPQILLSLP